jgi:hypothetical protein
MTALVISKLASKKLVVIIELERDGIVPSIPPKGSLPACLQSMSRGWFLRDPSTRHQCHTTPYPTVEQTHVGLRGMEWNGMIYGTL